MTRVFEGKELPEGFRIGTEEDMPLIKLTLAQAFADSEYPVPSNAMTYQARLKFQYEVCGSMAENGLEKGTVLTNEDFSAVLVTVDIADMCVVPLEEICEHMQSYATEENIANVKAIFDHIGELEQTLTFGNDVIYVEELAVQPAHQGEKRGSKLMRRLIAEAREMGKDLMLFTNTERNVSIYRHWGFDVVLEDYCEELNSYTAFMYCRTGKTED